LKRTRRRPSLKSAGKKRKRKRKGAHVARLTFLNLGKKKGKRRMKRRGANPSQKMENWSRKQPAMKSKERIRIKAEKVSRANK